MKKTLIALAIAGAVGIGGYVALNKAGSSIAEQQLTNFINENKNKPIKITQLEADPLIEKAHWTIKENKDNKVRSVLLFKLVGEDALEIPLNSEIIRGKTEYNGQSYGFGKIVTHPDLSQFKDLLKVVNNQTLTSTQYIALDGNVTSVENIAEIKIEADEKFDFGGLTAETHLSLLTPSAYDTKIQSKKLTITVEEGADEGQLELSPFNLSFKIDKEGNYTGDSSPFSLQVTDSQNKQLTNISFSEGDYHGTHKSIKGLISPMSNGKATFKNIIIDGVDIGKNQLNNINIEGGIYEAGNSLVNFKGILSTDIDGTALKSSELGKLLAASGTAITPTALNIEYEFSNLGYDIINTYYTTLGMVDDDDFELSEETQQQLVSSLQKTGAALSLIAGIKSEEGNADAHANLAFNEKGKSATAKTIIEALRNESPKQASKLVSAEANMTVDEELAERTGASMMLQLMLGIAPKDSKYTIDAEIKDGKLTINGQPMM